MGRWADDSSPVVAAITGFARQVSDPVRLTVLQMLATEGPTTMSEIAEVLELPAPRLGNHLARLRESGLVTVHHSGRHAVYRIAHPRTAEILASLATLADHSDTASQRAHGLSPQARARTCYGHLAGRLGVGLFAAAVRRRALEAPDPDQNDLRLGPDAADFFGELGVDPAALDPGRRKLATACLDWLERRPHLAGALGDAVLDALITGALITRRPGSRELAVTTPGTARLQPFLDQPLT